MLRGVARNAAFDWKAGGNFDVVNERILAPRPADPQRRAGKAGQQRAGGSRVHIEDSGEPAPPQLLTVGQKSVSSKTWEIAGWPSTSAAQNGCTRNEILKSGRHSCSASMAGKVKTTSPMDRKRMTRISAPKGRSGRTEEGLSGGAGWNSRQSKSLAMCERFRLPAHGGQMGRQKTSKWRHLFKSDS